MPTYEQLSAALVKADAAGNADDAKLLAAEIRKMKQPKAQDDPGTLETIGAALGKGVGDVALGAQGLLGKGLRTLGAEKAGQWLVDDATRGKEALAQQFSQYKEASPMTASVGEFAGNVAGTLPVGGGLAAVARPVLAGAGSVGPAILNALRSSGASVGPVNALSPAANLAIRSGAGATVGGVSAAMLNPDDAQTGAVIGGALPVVGKLASGIPSGLANVIGGLGTHTGAESIKAGTRAGFEGGKKAQEFAANMRGSAQMDDVLADAKAAVEAIRQARSNAYVSDMAKTGANKSVLAFDPIDKALSDAMKVSSFKGKEINRSATGVKDDINQIVEEWRNADKAEFHTIEGFDALKKSIGDIRDSTQPHTPSRVIADRVYNAVKDQIVKLDPKYAETMKDYETASKLLKEIERSLVSDKASADTAIRKLQSLTRNNVNTNYGQRVKLAKELESAGAENLMSNLSAQALSAWQPRGLGGLTATGLGGIGIATANPAVIPAMLAQSPRIMGETAFATGKAARSINNLAKKTGLSPEVINALIYKSAPVAGAQ